MRIPFQLSAIWLFAQFIAGQAALLRSDAILANTCLGKAELKSTASTPPADVVIAVFADTLREEEWGQFRLGVTSFYQASKSANPLRLAVMSGVNVRFAGPFKTAAELQTVLADLTSAPRTTDAVQPVQFYSNLGTVLQQFGADWSTVILAGHFPSVDPDLAPFLAGWFSTRLRAAKLRASYWTLSIEASQIMDTVVPGTSGIHLTEGLTSFAETLKAPDQFREVSWSAPPPTVGFRVCPVTLIDANNQTLVTVPSIVAASGAVIPDLDRFALSLEKIKSLSATLKQLQLSPEQTSQAEADLNLALEMGPRDEQVLRLGVDLYKRLANDSKLAALLNVLTELVPNEAALFTGLGHSRYRMQDWEGADHALLRSWELKPGDAAVSEELMRIRLARKDDRAALPFLEDTIAAKAGNQELWLLRADVSTRLQDWRRIVDSVEHAISLGNVPLERRTALVRLYLEHQNPERALLHVHAVAENLPSDAGLRSEYAGFLDELKQPKEALPAWKRVLQADPKLELAHYRVTRLLIEQDALGDALQAAEAGIDASPQSARLYLAKAEVLEKTNHFYDARRALRRAAPTLPDASLLARLAEMEDAGGEHAAQYYRKLAEVAARSLAERNSALDHGMDAALRDGDFDNAAWFQSQLATAVARQARRAAVAPVPGGLAALSFVARSKSSAPERFLVEYARTAVHNLSVADKKAAAAYTESIRDHFRRIAELSALGQRSNTGVTVTIAVQDKKTQKSAETILGLLGWKIHSSRQGVKLEAAESGARAKHHETASALAIDEIGMQQAVEAGKPFSFDIPTESAGVILTEETWRTQFYSKEKYSGGLAEAIACDLDLARTYAGLGQMDASSVEALASGMGLKTLAEKYSNSLYRYSSALAVERGRAAIPGGEPADAVWSSLVKADPRQPAAFFRALFTKDDGLLLAFYSALSELNIRHQRFFTSTPSRTAKFYELFKEAPENQRGTAKRVQSGSFVDFLSEVPLDNDGTVDFPGSPEVWTVAKGQSHSAANTAKLLKKVKRSVAPDVVDEILLRLARTRYKEAGQNRGELDNFLAVVRIDAHRSDPLDEASALMLAQHFAEYEEFYPYFAMLTGLQQAHFQQFFAMADTLRGLSNAEQNAQLGFIDPLIKILSLAQQAGSLTEAQAAALFAKTVDRFQHSAPPAARVGASVDLIREILASMPKPASADPDQALRSMLLGADAPPAEVFFENGTVGVDSSKARHDRYQQVLELQKVPTLSTVLTLLDAARHLGAGKGPVAEQIQALESSAKGLYFVEVPKELKLKGKQRESIEGFRPHRLQDIVKQLREKTAKQKVNPKDLEKLSQEYLAEMDMPVSWSLQGIVYAYYLSPEDLLVSEDPLLLRKHQFTQNTPGLKARIFERAQLAVSSESAGSNFVGTFASFGDAAGRAATQSSNLGGEFGQMNVAKQFAALRSTNWERLHDQDLRLANLKITVAREWIVRAATQPEVKASLAEASLGLLSLTRRADLLASLADSNWRSVWKLVTLSDLYFLGADYVERYSNDPWQSPATRALRELTPRNDGSAAQWLGAQFDDTFGCSHPHLRSAPPYEEYEKDFFPNKLAERSAEFKLYLAQYADAAGVPAAALGALAEPAARAILKRMQMSDLHDWRSVVAAYSTLDDKLIENILVKQ